MAGSELSEEDRRTLSKILEQRHGKVAVMPVEGNPRALIVKTTHLVAPRLRESRGEIALGGKKLVTVLTSGSIGKLKRRASWSETIRNGEVP